jgi:hypothetical protein
VRDGHDRLQAETLDHDRRMMRRQSGIDQQGHAAFFAQRFVKPNDRAFTRHIGVTRLLAQVLEESV